MKCCNMNALFLVFGFFQSFVFVCSESCVQATDYVCNQIPTGYPPGLSSLVFFLGNIGEINSTVFNNTDLSSVISVTMTHSGITAIAPGAFAQFQSLKMLNLRSNGLTQMTSDWFTHKDVLETLNLINNSITTLNEKSFVGFVGLSYLHLAQNLIHTVTKDSFHSLFSLRHLDLSNNKLRRLSVDTLVPLNTTKIFLHGNLWDCSCSVYEFSLYIRELRKISLLQNEMDVLCESPDHQRGRPVWNVSECVNPVTDEALTTRTSHPVTPGTTNRATIISLSVLYHRKQAQKKRGIIQPFPDKKEKQTQHHHTPPPDIFNTEESISCERRRKESNNRLLLKLDQPVLESQIYQIYTGLCHTELAGRAKSAGPVLSRSDGSGRHTNAEVEDHEMWIGKDQSHPHAGWIEQPLEKLEDKKTGLKEKEEAYGSKDEEGQVGTTDMVKQYQRTERRDDEFITTLKTAVTCEQNLEGGEKGEHILEGTVKDQVFQHIGNSVPSEEEFYSDDDDNSSSSLAKSQPPHEHDDSFQLLADVENMPYLTIGTDSEKQSPNPEQICTKASSGQLNLRPIRRTLSWPPTAAQWKKQWAQTQQVHNVSPQFIFVTQYEYHIGMLPSSAIPEHIPQASSLVVPQQQLQIKETEHIQSIKPSIEMCEFFSQGCIRDSSSLTRDYAEIKEGPSDILNSHPPVNDEAHSNVITIKPLREVVTSEGAHEVNMRSSKKSQKKLKSPKGEQERAISGRQMRFVDGRDGRKVLRDREKDQSLSGSGAHPSGGSPSDDSLLVDNEYTFINLLHEVVENHGRWTRERSKQSHINKQKIQHVTKA